MVRFLTALLIVTFSFLSGTTHAAQLRSDHPSRYVVVKGDTLWGIANKFFEDPWEWFSIWRINPRLANPHLIYPGDTIILAFEGGKPRLLIKPSKRTIRLSPRTQISGIDSAIPVISIEAIRPFLTRHLIVSPEKFDKAPYIAATTDEHLITSIGDEIFVRRLQDNTHRQYGIYRIGKNYSDPDSGITLGQEAIFVGEARLQEEGEPAVLAVTASSREMLIGDRLMPVSNEIEIYKELRPKALHANIQGHIIAVFDGVTQIGQHKVVVLSRGEQDGLSIGHVMAAYKSAHIIEDNVVGGLGGKVTLPERKAGLILIFRVFDRVSYGLVLKATRPMMLYDRVRKP